MSQVKLIPIILVDNREQLDYKFSEYNVRTIPTTLKTGDYSVAIQLISKDEKSIINYISRYFGILYTENIKFDTIIGDKVSTLIKFDNEIAIERKSLDNFVGDLTDNRDRFENSVQRGSSLKYFTVLIEGSEVDIENHKYEGQINPKSIINTAIGWQVKHKIPINFCTNRFNAEYWTYTTLMSFLRYKKEGKL